ncbi:MAG: hypothetical protein AB7P40_09035 [Chloroflexota bacterium]
MIHTTDAPSSGVQKVFRWLLGLTLAGTGISHLTWARTEFQAQVPRWVPMDPDRVVVLSGIVEVGLGAALVLLSRQRVAVGWIVAAFFVAVFPGNVSQYVHRVSAFGLNTDTARFVRLFFQPVLVVWALWSTGACWGRRNRGRAHLSASAHDVRKSRHRS